jgi:hypothetical protein
MHPLAHSLAVTFQRDFASADREIEWVSAEEERALALAPDTLLIGRVDARGRTGGEAFFGEWKTASPAKARRMDEVKAAWRTDPQALTYGVLLGPETRRFTVRWAIKTATPTTAFEWYSYTDAEIDHWRDQLLGIAHEIRCWRRDRDLHGRVAWRTNFGNCDRYGAKYMCPFFEPKCSHLAFAKPMNSPRTGHTELEKGVAAMMAANPQLVVLSGSRVDDYLGCPEAYRNKWEGAGYTEENENLTIGTDFHSLIRDYIRSMIHA